jgi:hypothetical protein
MSINLKVNSNMSNEIFFEDLELEGDFLVEKLHSAQSKRAVVIVGRFNPPTIGHYKVINRAKKFIRERKDLNLFTRPIVVLISGKKTSKDKKKNPMSAADREYYMRHSGRANGVIFLNATNAYDAFNEVRKHGFEPIVIGAGSDRANGYLDLLDKKFLDVNGKKQKHYSLTGLDRKELPATEKSLDNIGDAKINDAEVSASLARKAVELD